MNAPDALSHQPRAEDRQWQLAAYRAIRQQTVALAAPLSAEDCQAQSMPDASPVKWHLAHTTWFFETFVLGEFAPHYSPPFAQYRMLFNSYYNAVGQKLPRPQRGLLTRPTLAQVMDYRAGVDDAMAGLIGSAIGARQLAFDALLRLGLNHEQQHQELILTDIKHLFSCNPTGPAYSESRRFARTSPGAAAQDGALAMAFRRFGGGIVRIGHEGDGFGFDNEAPAHEVLLPPFELADRLVTCGEYLAFIQDGGYRRPELWLSLGWDRIQAEDWHLPLYWRHREAAAPGSGAGAIEEFTLQGWQPLEPAAPVSHLSFFEADAFARWAGARLPTEAEWEHAARHCHPDLPAAGGAAAGTAQAGPVAQDANLLERGLLHPVPASDGDAGHAGPGGDSPIRQLWGDLWEWTASPYVPYPGFTASAGAVGEYNGKFMCNQYVLRGGSFATPRDHIRASYRNFFPPEARWQFSGLRLARDGDRRAAASLRR